MFLNRAALIRERQGGALEDVGRWKRALLELR